MLSQQRNPGGKCFTVVDLMEKRSPLASQARQRMLTVQAVIHDMLKESL